MASKGAKRVIESAIVHLTPPVVVKVMSPVRSLTYRPEVTVRARIGMGKRAWPPGEARAGQLDLSWRHRGRHCALRCPFLHHSGPGRKSIARMALPLE